MQVFDLEAKDDSNNMHDLCGTRDDKQFENCLSIHNASCKIDLGEFDKIISDCHIVIIIAMICVRIMIWLIIIFIPLTRIIQVSIVILVIIVIIQLAAVNLTHYLTVLLKQSLKL